MNERDLRQLKNEMGEIFTPLREQLFQLIRNENLSVEIIALDNGCFQIRHKLDNYFFVEIALELNYKNKLQFFFHFCQWITEEGLNPQSEEIPLIKKLVPTTILNLGKYKHGKYHLMLTPNEVLNKLKTIIRYRKELLSACKDSTNYNPDGTQIRKFKSWKSKARITRFHKTQGIVRVYQSIPQSQQYSYDNSPFIHGSNGSYAENAPYVWVIDILIHRMSYEIDEESWNAIDIHDYITTQLMPKLGWQRITQSRLDWIKSVIEGQNVDVITYEMDKPPIYRDFVPEKYKSWIEYLDNLFDKALSSESE